MSYLDTHGLNTLWVKIKNYISNYHDSSKLNTSNVSHETWTFTLDDDSTVTKEVTTWTSQQ